MILTCVSAFPHSDICGSRLICSSPQLFAACHVLLRRLMPRHPPYALISLIYFYYLLSCPSGQLKNSLFRLFPIFFSYKTLFSIFRSCYLLPSFWSFLNLSAKCSLIHSASSRSRYYNSFSLFIYYIFSISYAVVNVRLDITLLKLSTSVKRQLRYNTTP